MPGSANTPASTHLAAPGTEKPRRFRPKLRYELIGCGLHGHEILGTDAAALRAEDELFARESGGLRWYRCLRCDSWVALTPPDHPTRKYPPARDEITLPLRGKPLRDRYVLRLIAIDRALHFLILSALAAAVFLFASDRAALNAEFTRILNDLQGGVGGPMTSSRLGIVHDLQYLFAVRIENLYLAGTAIAAYAVLEGVEAVGLWFGKRWAEYLTFVATIVFIPIRDRRADQEHHGAEGAGAGHQPGHRGLPALRQAPVRPARRRQGRASRTATRTPDGLLSSVPPRAALHRSGSHTQPSQREPRAASTLTVREPTAGSTGASGAAVTLSQAARAPGCRKRVSWPNPCRSSRPRR